MSPRRRSSSRGTWVLLLVVLAALMAAALPRPERGSGSGGAAPVIFAFAGTCFAPPMPMSPRRPSRSARIIRRPTSKGTTFFGSPPSALREATTTSDVPLSSSSSPTASGATSNEGETKSGASGLVKYVPLLDFAVPTTIDVVDRLDDAIMGGISTSSVIYCDDNPTKTKGDDSAAAAGYAKWFGVCREDGGGFCGWRTNPFKSSLPVAGYDGLYVVAQLASDDDVNRRVWKLSTRTRPDRGEQLYQAPIVWPQHDGNNENDENWTTIRVPFDSFKLVRGPRIVPDGPLLDVTGGLYQIGMTMGKFVFAGSNGNGTRSTLENFRPGFFQLNLKEIGAYNEVNDRMETQPQEAVEDTTSDNSTELMQLSPRQVLTKDEAKKQRPVWLRILAPILQLVFLSEQRQRRKSAMRILKKRYGMGTGRATMFALEQRSQCTGWVRALARTARIALEETVRFAIGLPLRVALIYPVRIVSRINKRISAPPTNAAEPSASKP